MTDKTPVSDKDDRPGNIRVYRVVIKGVGRFVTDDREVAFTQVGELDDPLQNWSIESYMMDEALFNDFKDFEGF